LQLKTYIMAALEEGAGIMDDFDYGQVTQEEQDKMYSDPSGAKNTHELLQRVLGRAQDHYASKGGQGSLLDGGAGGDEAEGARAGQSGEADEEPEVGQAPGAAGGARGTTAPMGSGSGGLEDDEEGEDDYGEADNQEE
jgi:hypothetical protein